MIKTIWFWFLRVVGVVTLLVAIEPGGPGVRLFWYLVGLGVSFWVTVSLVVLFMAQLVLQLERDRGPLFYLAMAIAAADAWVCVLFPFLRDAWLEFKDRGLAKQQQRFALIRAQRLER